MLKAFSNISFLKNPRLISYTFARDIQRIPPMPKKEGVYVPTENYNYEEHESYTIKVEKALKTFEEGDTVHRVKKKLRFDKPKWDLNLDNYFSWRVYDRFPICTDEDKNVIPSEKIELVPKHLIHAFGIGMPAERLPNSSLYEWDFNDVDFDHFLLYDYRCTTEYWGENDDHYDYERQDHIPPPFRRYRRMSKEEFLETDEPMPFRILCGEGTNKKRFKKWLHHSVNIK